MKTGILITVRTGSTRLPKKALKEAAQRPIISYLITRMKEVNEDLADIVICTTTLEEDNVLDDVAGEYGVNCFHGDVDNIIKRHFDCGKHFGLDFIVNIDGDDILCDPEYVRRIIEFANTNDGYDVVKTSNLPFGVNSMGYRHSVLENILNRVDNSKLETGWGSLIIDKKIFSIKEIMADKIDMLDVRLTLDYEDDFLLFSNIIENLFKENIYVSNKEIVDYLKHNPEVRTLNSHLNEIYWQNFNAKKCEGGS